MAVSEKHSRVETPVEAQLSNLLVSRLPRVVFALKVRLKRGEAEVSGKREETTESLLFRMKANSTAFPTLSHRIVCK